MSRNSDAEVTAETEKSFFANFFGSLQGVRHDHPDRHGAGGAVHRLHRRQHREHGGARARRRDRGAAERSASAAASSSARCSPKAMVLVDARRRDGRAPDLRVQRADRDARRWQHGQRARSAHRLHRHPGDRDVRDRALVAVRRHARGHRAGVGRGARAGRRDRCTRCSDAMRLPLSYSVRNVRARLRAQRQTAVIALGWSRRRCSSGSSPA